MAILKPFRGIRPKTDMVEKVASKPYDVINEREASIVRLIFRLYVHEGKTILGICRHRL